MIIPGDQGSYRLITLSLIGQILLIILLYSCKESHNPLKEAGAKEPSAEIQSSETVPEKELSFSSSASKEIDYDSSLWTEIIPSTSYLLDLKYATLDNFTAQVIYPCSRCFLKPIVAKKLDEINKIVQKERAWHIKLFDCYRPVPAQQKLWNILPNPTYVTNPKKGSMHSRGVAVDLTFVDEREVEIDMGSPFDHFGRVSRHDYTGLPPEIQKNRTYLKELMTRSGFKSIKSEWWHYSLSGTGSGLSDWEWGCE